MPSDKTERLQHAIEQLHADESLLADLTDPSAEAVYSLLETQLRSASGLDDPAFAARVAQLRQAARAAARAHADSLPDLLSALSSVLEEPRVHASIGGRRGPERRFGRPRRQAWRPRGARA